MNKLKIIWPYLLITAVVVLFFFPVFKGLIPFPGDLLVNENPYKTQGFLGYAPGGYPNKAQGPDVIELMYPWRYFAIGELKKGNVPFWNPYNFSGNPQMANFQTAVFYPFNILYFIFSFNFAWTIIVMLQPFLAGIFMYLFLAKGLSLKKFPSFIGGISFAFSAYMAVWLEYGNIGNTFLWLPLALFLTKRMHKKITAANYALFTIVLIFTILAGYIQIAFYSYLVIILYYLYLFKYEKNINWVRNLIVFTTSLIFSVVLTSFQLLPTLGLFVNSARGSYSLSQIPKLLMPPVNLIAAFVPDFFGNPATRNYWLSGTYIERVIYAGVAVLFFAVYGAVHSKNREKNFFIGLSIISLIIATDFPGIKFLYLIPIPVISTTIPTRELYIFIFGLIVISALGLDYWLSEKNYKTKLALIFGLVYVFIWGLVFLLPKFLNIPPVNVSIAKRNLILPTILAFATIAAFYIKKINVKVSLIAITLIVCFDLFYFFNKITPFSSTKLIYPTTPVVSFLQRKAGINRFWGYGSAYISPNFQTFDKTYSPEGYDALHLKSYGELLASSRDGVLPESLPGADANIAPGYGTEDLKTNFYRRRILDLLGVKYVLGQQQLKDAWKNPDFDTFPKSQFTLIKKIYPWQVYENRDALPRFFIASNYLVQNRRGILSSIYNKNTDLRKTVLLEENPKSKIDKNAKGQAKLISYRPNTIKFKTVTDGSTILFLSDNYYPDWQAFVDGVKTKIYRADYTFRAVVVPKGAHFVEFTYNPRAFEWGIAISILGLLLLVITLGIFYYCPERKNVPD